LDPDFELLANAYKNALRRAKEKKLTKLALHDACLQQRLVRTYATARGMGSIAHTDGILAATTIYLAAWEELIFIHAPDESCNLQDHRSTMHNPRAHHALSGRMEESQNHRSTIQCRVG